jgi:hypothetical protein
MWILKQLSFLTYTIVITINILFVLIIKIFSTNLSYLLHLTLLHLYDYITFICYVYARTRTCVYERVSE